MSRNFFRRNFCCTPRLRDAHKQEQGNHEENVRDENHAGSDTGEKENVETVRPSRLLPQSPLLTKVKTPLEKTRKKRPKKEDIDRLRRNPWAVALASPPRMCSITGSRLPKALLGEYGLVRRPGSESLWFMPVGLLEDELKAAAPGTGAGVQEQGAGDKDNMKSKKSTAGPLHLRVIRILYRLLLLKEITAQFIQYSGKKSPLQKLIPFRWKNPKGPLTPRDMNNLVWREDMPSFVMKNMRKEAVKALEKASWASDLSLNKSADRLESESHPSQESDESSREILPSESPSTSFTSVFPDYVTLPQRGTKVPVFDLSVLLSETDREQLRKSHPRFRNQALFFRPGGTVPVDAMLALWRLKGFTMYDREFLEEDPSIDPIVK
ncbi:hypothetical protein T310_0444 [Rasamsonia emersonii CBS 393.64]|uniref:Uncharacterized protein n=1 Tax=Rasamsonia emersonii (strain ATCC 16479 / CBS 393.64 / IMI 116815) TaxID=1408163 RepID=A0A0F4Z4V5_RASE3|nr:hypothetical protein T310_0444 [Rasamsonia emersonii CBS 393.64]KKA25564.1 hypothetical protein T310_0444 [Rasamsonia emersonii CBS 393.64]